MQPFALPDSHPLAERVAKAARYSKRSRHFSPLHDLMGSYGLKPKVMEKRKAVRYEANWDPGLIVHICEEEKEALRMVNEDEADVQIFTDGSGYKGHVGASAVLFRNGEEIAAVRYRLGHEDDHEVYEGELVGMVMGLHLASREQSIRELSIWADNTAAITATDTSSTNSSHYILDIFHSLLTRLRAAFPEIQIKISWVPGHKGIEGNERADQEAKKAAAGRSSNRRMLPEELHCRLPRSRTAAVRVYRRKLEKQHDDLWKKSPRYAKFKDIDPAPATKASRNYWKLSRHLPRKLLTILTQLRTGHIPLQKHLYNIKRADSPTCPCCRRHPETVFHYLFQCSAHREARDRLRRNVSKKHWSMSSLLTSPKLLRHLFLYVDETKRFHHILGDLPELPEEEDE